MHRNTKINKKKNVWMVVFLSASAIVLFFSLLFALPADINRVYAQNSTIEKLQEGIQERNQKISELEKEIVKYESQIAKTGEEAKTLQTAISRLNTERKKLLSEIAITENRIQAASLTIEHLSNEISTVTKKIETSEGGLAQTIRILDENDQMTMLDYVLTGQSVSEVFDQSASVSRLQADVRVKMTELRDLRDQLSQKSSETAEQKEQLTGFKEKIIGQKEVTEANKKAQDRLLQETKNQEAEYKKEVERRKAEKEAFEKELFELESQLHFEIDASNLPKVGTKIFEFPLSNATTASCLEPEGSRFINCVTQYFGNTPFAKSGAYGGRGHNGMDFRASTGTEISAPLSGTVRGTGNTDIFTGCKSYGGWVLLDHGNGLSSVFGHMSIRSVKAGDKVKTGETIGLSGGMPGTPGAGHSTGPHLHWTVFATEGVKIMKLADIPGRKTTACSPATIPVADLRAYMNPIEFL
ncbi:MAG: peptidoglycan DD-metalloendopeptidase family protein [bacterium]|nr:peptidoglycan DD-metalloendopeptidase family protein [bacterium]